MDPSSLLGCSTCLSTTELFSLITPSSHPGLPSPLNYVREGSKDLIHRPQVLGLPQVPASKEGLGAVVYTIMRQVNVNKGFGTSKCLRPQSTWRSSYDGRCVHLQLNSGLDTTDVTLGLQAVDLEGAVFLRIDLGVQMTATTIHSADGMICRGMLWQGCD